MHHPPTPPRASLSIPDSPCTCARRDGTTPAIPESESYTRWETHWQEAGWRCSEGMQWCLCACHPCCPNRWAAKAAVLVGPLHPCCSWAIPNVIHVAIPDVALSAIPSVIPLWFLVQFPLWFPVQFTWWFLILFPMEFPLQFPLQLPVHFPLRFPLQFPVQAPAGPHSWRCWPVTEHGVCLSPGRARGRGQSWEMKGTQWLLFFF